MTVSNQLFRQFNLAGIKNLKFGFNADRLDTIRHDRQVRWRIEEYMLIEVHGRHIK